MNSPEKRIIIHAGPGKTGTSAIQAWLTQHNNELSEKDIYYPKHSLNKNSISSGNLRKLLSRNEQGKWQVDNEKLSDLLDDFNSRPESTMLISSEFFFHNILQLHKALPQAEFIIYVRNPVELLESNYNQGVKRHSVTREFKAPSSLDNFFWSYLDNVFSKVPHKQLHLRSYHKELYIEGSIVNDLLSVMGVSFDVEKRTVNPSFTFPALEFKRLMNHFSLGRLEQQLDTALQAIDIGLQKYSLMSSDDFERLNKQSIRLMDNFILKHDQTTLLPLRDLFASTKQNKVVSHKDIRFEQLFAVTTIINNRYNHFYEELREKVRCNTNLLVSNDLIYQVFNVEPHPIDLTDDVDRELVKQVEAFTVAPAKYGKIMYELGVYFSESGDHDNALKFSRAACSFNENNLVFSTLLNRQLVIRNAFKQANSQSSYSSQSFYLKIKKRLARTTLGQKLKRLLNPEKRNDHA